MRDGAKRLERESGSITILALWALAIVAVILAAVAATTRAEIAIAGNAVAAARARHAAEAGAQLGLVWLLRRRNEAIADFEGTPEIWQDGSALVEIRIVDEAGKIDINLAPTELLAGLFVAVGQSREEALLLACAIATRRGNAPATCPGGTAERSGGYRFTAPEELAQLPGFDGTIYDKIADYVTVATGATAIAPRAAARPVLLAVPGATPELVDAYLGNRAAWRDFGGLGDNQIAAAAGLYVMASPRRDFTISALSAVGQARHRADLQVRLTGLANHPYELIAWRTPPAERSRAATPPPRRVP